MQPKDVIRQSLDMSDFILNSYLADLSDADLQVRAVAGMNPIAWQVGHLIVTERNFVEGIRPGSCPPLPEGFEPAHARQAGQAEDTAKYRSQAEYLALWKAQRTATRAVLDALTDADLDAPGPEQFRRMAPTAGAVLNFAGIHALM
ncbi:MAG TPA: DinB family protein, partial [Isosphaeraceae bacterium]